MADAVNWSSVLRLPGLTTTACGLACFAADAAFAKDPCLVYRPREYTRSARYSMNRALELQAAEARVLSQTLWNHHFEIEQDPDLDNYGQGTAELRPSGRAHLERLARRYPFGGFELSIQTAHDFRFTDDDPDAYFTHRRELDALRTQAVTDYLQRIIPHNSVAIQVHDRPPVGINGSEALRAYSQMVNQASVLIPDDSNGQRFMFGFGDNSGGVFGGGGQGGGGQGGSGVMPFPASGPGPTGNPQSSFANETPSGPQGSAPGSPPPPPPPPGPNPGR